MHSPSLSTWHVALSHSLSLMFSLFVWVCMCQCATQWGVTLWSEQAAPSRCYCRKVPKPSPPVLLWNLSLCFCADSTSFEPSAVDIKAFFVCSGFIRGMWGCIQLWLNEFEKPRPASKRPPLSWFLMLSWLLSRLQAVESLSEITQTE